MPPDLEPQIEFSNGTPVGVGTGSGGSGTISTALPISGDGSSGNPATIANGAIADASLATSYLKADGSRALSADWGVGSHKITGLADPSSAQDAATKAYVDAAAQGFDLKASVRAATTANVNLASMPASIDGVTLSSGNRFLAKNQTAGAENAFYVFNGAGAAATRSTDADTSAKVTSGAFTFVSEGTVNGGTSWALITADPITLGTTSLSFTQTHGPGTYTAGTGLSLTGVQFAIDATVATLTGSQILTNKTLTTPTINAATLSGILAGAHTLSGVATFTAAPIVAIDDATTNAVTDVSTLRHTTSGTAAAGIGTGLLFSAENASGSNVDIARIAALLTTATGGSEVSALTIGTRTGGAIVEYMRLHGSGAVSFGNTSDQGSKGGLTWGNGVNNATQIQQVFVNSSALDVIKVNGAGGITTYGNGSYTTKVISASSLALGGASSTWATLDSTSSVWGLSDASASAGNYTFRGANITGADAAGPTTTRQAPLGTGTGTPGIYQITGGEKVSSGSAQHNVVTLAQFQDSDTNDDTAFLVRVRRSGVETVSRVTIGAADSGGSGFKLLRVVN